MYISQSDPKGAALDKTFAVCPRFIVCLVKQLKGCRSVIPVLTLSNKCFQNIYINQNIV